MALNYRDLRTRETDLVRELHCLDAMLPQDLQGGSAQYPQLFDNNQDSLFSPDAMFGGSGNPAHLDHLNRGVDEQQRQGDKQMFQEYLDSLEISQFIRVQSELQKSGSKNGTKSFKNLENSLDCTFKPSILKKSSQIAIGLGPSFQRLTQNPLQKGKTPYQPQEKLKKTYSKERIERLSKPRAMKTEPSQVIEPIKQNIQKKYHMPRNSYGMDVAARNQLWQDQKNQKIQRLREEEQANKLKRQGGTFIPKTTQYKGERGANISNFGKEGIANYFERVNMAKQKQPKQNSSFLKENTYSQRRDSISPYGSTKRVTRTPTKNSVPNTQGKARPQQQQQRVKYEDAVKELHRKLMSLNI